MKKYVGEKEDIEKEKEKKNKKQKEKDSSTVTKKDLGLTENAKVLLE